MEFLIVKSCCRKGDSFVMWQVKWLTTQNAKGGSNFKSIQKCNPAPSDDMYSVGVDDDFKDGLEGMGAEANY